MPRHGSRENISLLLLLGWTNLFAVFVDGQGTKVENFVLSASSPTDCGVIIQASTFGGDCCSLQDAIGGGCVLTVLNGRCIVRGQYWFLDFTSTLSSDGATCPPSEYDVPLEPPMTTAAPTPRPRTAAPTSTPYLSPRCGDCWCIPGDDGSDECPNRLDDIVGIKDDFDLFENVLWATFRLSNPDAPFLTLDEGCYPFREALGGIAGSYRRASGPQCTRPTVPGGGDGVCAYLLPQVTRCGGRPYEIVSYESRQAAEQAGAVVTHEGGCGVCSSTQDLWATIRNVDTFEDTFNLCSMVFELMTSDAAFDDLVECFTEIGFSLPCATLYAHSAATRATQCDTVCTQDSLGVPIEPLPACNQSSFLHSPCLACSETWKADFNVLAGRTMPSSGILDRIARHCDEFAQVIHDPCVNIAPPPTTPPTDDASGPPPNDRCIASIRLEENVQVTDNTAMANFDYINQNVCGPASDHRAVWYTLSGSGGEITISLCANNNRAAAFGVFQRCNSQECVGFSSNVATAASCANPQAATSYTFSSVIGESYYVHVREADAILEGGASFNIVYTDDDGSTPGPTGSPTWSPSQVQSPSPSQTPFQPSSTSPTNGPSASSPSGGLPLPSESVNPSSGATDADGAFSLPFFQLSFVTALVLAGNIVVGF